MADNMEIFINGASHKVAPGELPADFSLNDFIRDRAVLTGTKKMCSEGGCGSCTVVVTCNNHSTEEPVNSCMVPIHMCNGWSITTVEGLGGSQTGYHPIQKSLADNNGSQCGYCSPGMVMSMYGAIKQNPTDIKTKLEGHFDGNICRCTGYRPIMNAMQKCADIEDLSKCGDCPHRSTRLQNTSELREIKSGEDIMWYKPSNLSELGSLIKMNSGVQYYLVAGHTGIGVYKHDGPYQCYIDINNVPDMTSITQTDEYCVVGAGVCLNQLISQFHTLSSKDGFKYLTEAARYLEQVANPQVRNMASWAGNLMLRHKHRDFVSDVFVLLETIGASLEIFKSSNSSIVTVGSVADFLKLDMTGNVIVNVKIPAKVGYQLQTYKVMPRYRNTHTLLSMGFFVKLDSAMKVTERPVLVYTGASSSFIHASDVENFLTGKTLADNGTLKGCFEILQKTPFDQDVLLPSVDYRRMLVKSLFYKAVLSLCGSVCRPDLVSGGEVLVRPDLSKGSQDFPTDPTQYPMTQPFPKLDARKQTAGEAQYVGDMPRMAGQLSAVFVKASIGSGNIKSIDVKAAAAAPGVVRVLTHTDIPGDNGILTGEQLLCDSKVHYCGQPVAIVIAECHEAAILARDLVKVEYEGVKTPILTIAQAIQAGSFHPDPPASANPVKGDAAGALKSCDHVVSGVLEVGEQYPMYMETQRCLVQPQEGYYLVHASTQTIVDVQASISRVLGISTNEVEVRVRRVGGGFGGKLMRSCYPAAAAALGSYHTQRPVEMCLSLEDNMEILGKRQPFRIEYQAGVNKDMKIQALSGNVYENCGMMTNESMAPVVARWLDSAYFIPNWDIKVRCVKTNQPNHSYVRAPGIISAMHFCEQIVEHMASELNVNHEVFREANLYKEGDKTQFEELMKPCYLGDMWNQLKMSCGFDQRSTAAEQYNQANMWRKKAVVMTPLKYGMAFWPDTSYMVHVFINYTDGGVTIIHAGVEIGQGINTRTIQVAAKALGIPMDIIKVQPTSSTVNHNSATTGGSVTSDMNCIGVQKACDILNERMAELRKTETDWKKLVEKCKTARIDLHAKHYATENDIVPGQKSFKSYDVFGIACAEIELDVLTGNYIIQEIDILYDAGMSYSPDIDIGQIEGAVVMGIGLLLHEEIKYDPADGKVVTNNTWNYKVPMNRDIPVNLSVKLVKNRPNDVFQFRSKIVGEPPFLLSESAVVALKRCVMEARKQQGDNSFLITESPFTVEKVLLGCNLNTDLFVIQ